MKTRILILSVLVLIEVPLQSFAEEGSTEYHVGTVQWLEASYPPGGTAVVRVVDPDMNLNSERTDNFDVFVRSDSHTKGLALTATETGVSTGVFDGTLFLTLNYEATGHRLKVAEGDTVTAEYEDSTLPTSYTSLDVLSIVAGSEIRPTLESLLKQFESGIQADQIRCNGNLVLIQKHEGFPACVTPETKENLIERGWGHSCLNGMFSEQGSLCITSSPGISYGTELESEPGTINAPLPEYPRGSTVQENIAQDRVSVFIEEYQMQNGNLQSALKPLMVFHFVGEHLFVIDADTKEIILHPDPDKIGTASWNLRDNPDEGFFIEIPVLQNPGYGFVNYTEVNPRDGKIDTKTSWLLEYDGLIFGSGFFASDCSPEPGKTKCDG